MPKIMFCKSGFILCCVFTIASNRVALADLEDKSDEPTFSSDRALQNDSMAMDSGLPDSHEAMNNREMNLGVRDKRSYSFLMGLIHNNSEYEVTKENSDKKLEKISQETSSHASELLLELMIKIASNPDQWKKVHNLLENINNDLIASKKLVDELQTGSPSTTETRPKEGIAIEKKIMPENHTKSSLLNNEWPLFQDVLDAKNNKAPFVNTALPENYPQHKSSYPKTFAYHRVTGRPMYINKNPKAYIAVSVIAPKPLNLRTKDEDLVLEKQLRQLKPWTHQGNLKNMAQIRSRWVIQKDADNVSIAP